MALFNKAVRDEYIILHTKNHIIITEYNLSLDCKCGSILEDLTKKFEKNKNNKKTF